MSIELKGQIDETTSALCRLEEASAEHVEAISSRQDELNQRLDIQAKIIAQTASMNNSQAIATRDTLAQVVQLLQLTSGRIESEQASRMLGKIREDIPTQSGICDMTFDQTRIDEVGSDVAQSIQRLGRLVGTKGRTFDTFYSEDDEYNTIVEDLDTILNSAKKRASDLAQSAKEAGGSRKYKHAARSIVQLGKALGTNIMAINTIGKSPLDYLKELYDSMNVDQVAYCRPQRKQPPKVLKQDSIYHKICMTSGLLLLKQNKVILECDCKQHNCMHCQPRDSSYDMSGVCGKYIEYVTTVTFMPYGLQSPYMMTASERSSRVLSSHYISSISYLALNPVVPSTSRVFQVVAEGNLQALREMLQDGEASLRDTDESGLSLLFVSTPPVIRNVAIRKLITYCSHSLLTLRRVS